ncbi:regulator of microtubule dynamics protein 1-like [Chironomus tepperi]|uniref:regulator of microtubule dynamics protein 1-like n=1 Tax=Chironomus tepperi TaxID=113505 RepID=UPI00391FB9D5
MVRLYHFALVVRRLLVENRSLLYQFHRFKKPAVASRLYKPHIYLAFLGFSFAKKEEEEVKSIEFIMVDQSSLEKADQLFDDNKFQEAVDFLKTLDQSSADVQWRLGRALFKCSGMDGNSSKKNELIRDAYKSIHEALQKDDNNFAIHKWYAILLDANANLDGMKARVQELENVKKHMVRAIELNPEDPTSRYILGEFAFGLADLPWYQRKIVSTIFATPPSATYEEALEHFLKAEDLKADFYSMNKLMIGKCYMALKDNEKAREYFTKASAITALNEDDRKCKEEATKLLSKVK